MHKSVVDRLHTEMKDLISLLDAAGEISMRSVADDNFRKALLLATASYFEHKITQEVIIYVRECANSNPLIDEFVQNRAISRQYHTWFDWKEKNANQFYGLFGKEFKDYMKATVRQNETLEKSVQAFMEIGRDRNRLVHQDFGSFTMEKTSEEIYDLYQSASLFVEYIPRAFKEFCIVPESVVDNHPYF